MWHIAAPFFQGFTASTALHLFIGTVFLLDGQFAGRNAMLGPTSRIVAFGHLPHASPCGKGLVMLCAAVPYSGVVGVSNGSRLIRRIFTWR